MFRLLMKIYGHVFQNPQNHKPNFYNRTLVLAINAGEQKFIAIGDFYKARISQGWQQIEQLELDEIKNLYDR